jgi:RHS repeat-associated protein
VRRLEDPFGNASNVDYDPNDLLVAATADALNNLVAATNDYRVLAPGVMTDPNGNQTAVSFDTLSLVVATAVMGKQGQNLGDLPSGFSPDLTQTQIDAFFTAADPHTVAAPLLGNATTRVVYDVNRFLKSRSASPSDPAKWQPAFAATLARETHVSDLGTGQQSNIQINVSYSDGFGREIQKKIQAEPGPVPERDASGKIMVGADGQPVMTASNVSPRWVGTGWAIFNNKGKPVRQYEPFFTDTDNFEFDVRIGVSPVRFYDPVERLVATLHPNHTWEKVIFDPWRQETWDVNDTVLVNDPKVDPDVGDFFGRLPTADYLPTWYAARQSSAPGVEEQDAARKAAIHAVTPTITWVDTLGRTFLTIAQNKFKYTNTPSADPPVEEAYRTGIILDIEGNQREVIDTNDRIVVRYDYDMLGNRIHQASMEAGELWMLNDVTGKRLDSWDSRDHSFRTSYDPLRRPTDFFLREGAGAEMIIGRSVYGETRPTPEANNLRGKVVQAFDQAGVVTSDEYDFKGNLLRSERQLARAYKATLDWTATVPLEPETYTSGTRYDALNRPIQSIAPHSDQPGATVNIIEPIYNEANLLDQVHVWLNQNAEPTGWLDPATANLHAVTNVDYNAKGQRTLIEYGNGATTSYEYDPFMFRLVHLLTQRDRAAFPADCPRPSPPGWPGCQVQNLHYTYDPAGNITHIRDDGQETIFFRNRRVEPSADYTYDAIYRLIEATGREHLGQNGDPIVHSYNDGLRVGSLQPGDGAAMGTYLERYIYDSVGNFLEMEHRRTDATNPGWTRAYAYNEASLLEPGEQSNRLSGTTVGNGNPMTEQYSYDTHGNTVRMPHLQAMQWDFKDQLQMTQRQAVDTEDADGLQHQGERTWYVYDSAGRRVRKVTERQAAAGQAPTRMSERIYMAGFEICREYENDGSTARIERETLHIMDDKQRIASVETRTQGTDPAPQQLIRYQFGNHLGSAVLELDDEAQIISYEEYTPYGSTSYQAVRSQTETAKRYRYTGKERDEETGLIYYGARYYSAWLGRWTSSDPGPRLSLNLFVAFSNNPTNRIDPEGDQDESWLGSAVRKTLSPAISLAVRGANIGEQVWQGVRRYEESQPTIYLSDYIKAFFTINPTTLTPLVPREQLPFAGFRGSAKKLSTALEHKDYATATESFLRARQQLNRGMEMVTAPLTLLLAPEAAPESLGTELELSAASRLSTGGTFSRGRALFGAAPSASKFVPSWDVTLKSQGGWWSARIGQFSEAEVKLTLDVLESPEVIVGRSFNVKGREMFTLDTWLKQRGIKWSQRWQDVYNKALFSRTSTGQSVNIMAGGGYTLGEVTAAEAGTRVSGVLNKPYWSSQPLGKPTWLDKIRRWLK